MFQINIIKRAKDSNKKLKSIQIYIFYLDQKNKVDTKTNIKDRIKKCQEQEFIENKRHKTIRTSKETEIDSQQQNQYYDQDGILNEQDEEDIEQSKNGEQQTQNNKKHLFKLYNITEVEKSLQVILNGENKYQVTNLRDLYKNTHPSITKYSDKMAAIFREQAKYCMKKDKITQLPILLMTISQYGNFSFQQSLDVCYRLDEFINQRVSQTKSIMLITFISIYTRQLLQLNKDKFLKTVELMNKQILKNQKDLPDSAILSNYITTRSILNIKPEEIKLKFNESTEIYGKFFTLLTKEGDTVLADQLLNHIKTQEIDLPTLSFIVTHLQDAEYFNLLSQLQDIKENQRIKYQDSDHLKATLISLNSLFKYLNTYIDKQQKVQQIKDQAQQIITKQKVSIVTNCNEIQSISILTGYSDYQKQCIEVLLDITKILLQKLSNMKTQNLTLLKVNLFYQISKLQIEIDPEMVQYALTNIKYYYPYIKMGSITDTFCTLSNLYQYQQNKSSVDQIITELEPKIEKYFMQEREKNDLFIPVYVAYLCQTHLQRENLTRVLLKTIEKTIDENKFPCKQKGLTVNYLEGLAQKNNKAKEIFQKLLSNKHFETLDENNIIQGLYHLKSFNIQTSSLILNSFEKCANKIQLKNLTYILHLLNRNSLSFMIKINEELIKKLKQRFLSAEEKDHHLIVTYRKNCLIDEQILQSIEQYAITQNSKNKLTPTQLINIFYNITRHRVACEQFIKLVDQVIPNFYNQLVFADYILLLSSQLAQKVQAEKISTTINQLLTRIQYQQINLENEAFQQKKLFYLFFQQIQYEYPGININVSNIEQFLTNMSKEIETFHNQQEHSNLEEEKLIQDDNLKTLLKDDSPYEEYVQKALQEQNIPFIREYRIGIFKVDFFLPEQNICIEMNGDLHYFNDKLTPPSELKNRYLENLKYKVISIRSTICKRHDSKGYQYGIISEYVKALIEENKQK